MSKHNYRQRKHLRMKGYDYSNAGLYFITICVQKRLCLFGDVENGEMLLNDTGVMVDKWYFELQNKFPNIWCHESVVMPNHGHYPYGPTIKNTMPPSGI